MTKLKSNIANSAIKLSIAKIITLSISMISAMLLSRFRSLEDYGTYSQLMTIINLFTSLLMLGLPNSINYFLAKSETNKERQIFINTYYTFSTILSLIVGIVLINSIPLIVRYFNNILIKNFIYFLAIYPWAKIITSSIENVLIVYGKANILMIYRIINSIALLAIIIISQILDLKFEIYMLLLVCVESIFAIIVYILVNYYSGKLTFYINIKMLKQILIFSIPLGIASVVGTLNIELDKLTIGNMLDTEQLAIYTNAAREMPVTIIATSITAVILPELTYLLKKNKYDKAISIWGNSIIVSYLIICFLATSFFVFAPQVMSVLYSDKYLAGVSVFRIYNIVLLLRCTYFAMILNAQGKSKFILYSSIASLILNIILNYICYFLFGFTGPAIATLLSTILIALCQLIYTTKITNINFKNILPWKYLSFITSINFIIGILLFITKKLMNMNEIVEAIILVTIAFVIYVLISFRIFNYNWNKLKEV